MLRPRRTTPCIVTRTPTIIQYHLPTMVAVAVAEIVTFEPHFPLVTPKTEER